MRVSRQPGPGRARLEALIEQSKKLSLRVGFFDTSKYADGTPVASVAAEQEFGVPSKRIPPRPFMRPTVTANKAKWSGLFARGSRAAIVGTIDLRNVFEQIGMVAAGDIAQAISKVQSPPLKASTLQLRKWRNAGIPIGKQQVKWAAQLAAKGLADTDGVSKKPLVDSGILFNAVTHEVSDDSGQ